MSVARSARTTCDDSGLCGSVEGVKAKDEEERLQAAIAMTELSYKATIKSSVGGIRRKISKPVQRSHPPSKNRTERVSATLLQTLTPYPRSQRENPGYQQKADTRIRCEKSSGYDGVSINTLGAFFDKVQESCTSSIERNVDDTPTTTDARATVNECSENLSPKLGRIFHMGVDDDGCPRDMTEYPRLKAMPMSFADKISRVGEIGDAGMTTGTEAKPKARKRNAKKVGKSRETGPSMDGKFVRTSATSVLSNGLQFLQDPTAVVPPMLVNDFYKVSDKAEQYVVVRHDESNFIRHSKDLIHGEQCRPVPRQETGQEDPGGGKTFRANKRPFEGLDGTTACLTKHASTEGGPSLPLSRIFLGGSSAGIILPLTSLLALTTATTNPVSPLILCLPSGLTPACDPPIEAIDFKSNTTRSTTLDVTASPITADRRSPGTARRFESKISHEAKSEESGSTPTLLAVNSYGQATHSTGFGGETSKKIKLEVATSPTIDDSNKPLSLGSLGSLRNFYAFPGASPVKFDQCETMGLSDESRHDSTNCRHQLVKNSPQTSATDPTDGNPLSVMTNREIEVSPEHGSTRVVGATYGSATFRDVQVQHDGERGLMSTLGATVGGERTDPSFDGRRFSTECDGAEDCPESKVSPCSSTVSRWRDDEPMTIEKGTSGCRLPLKKRKYIGEIPSDTASSVEDGVLHPPLMKNNDERNEEIVSDICNQVERSGGSDIIESVLPKGMGKAEVEALPCNEEATKCKDEGEEESESKENKNFEMSEALSSPGSSSASIDSKSAANGSDLISAILPDEDGDLPLHVAVVQGLVDVVSSLIDLMSRLHVSPDSFNKNRQTPLHLAVITKTPIIVRRLLMSGASPNLSDRKGHNSVHLAVVGRTTECLRTLLVESKVRVDINAMNYEGLTALHLAVQFGDVDAVELLLASGAQVNGVDGKNGRTALYYAAESGCQAMTERLLRLGASPLIPSYSGCLPVNAARYNDEIIKLLERHSTSAAAAGGAGVGGGGVAGGGELSAGSTPRGSAAATGSSSVAAAGRTDARSTARIRSQSQANGRCLKTKRISKKDASKSKSKNHTNDQTTNCVSQSHLLPIQNQSV